MKPQTNSYFKVRNAWIVIEDPPRPDNFIAIMAPGWDGQTLVPHSSYHTELGAALRARYLMDKFEAKKIKIFYPNGRSRIMT